MPNITTWLAEIGLEKYVYLFEDAEIDFDTLPDLREEDLKELKLPLGPRRKIWSAITRLVEYTDGHGTVGRTSSIADHETISAVHPAHAERRHLTVMFVDLVGSTEMVMRMDAEDMRAVIAEYQKTVASVVKEYEGFIATLLGDGLLCYFGWPHANEDDTERAVRAGLSVIKATQRIVTPDGAALASRVGVASGVVVVGDLTGGGARQEAAVIGETPNLAARLQGVAEPNQLVVPGDALPLLGTTFDLVALGPQKLKGVSKSIDAYIVKGETAVESRFAARRSGVMTPIVGRAREINKILGRWPAVKSGHGQMIMLSGEAGIGKSRITQAVVDAISSDAPLRLTYQCSHYHSESAFYPIIQQLSYTAGFTSDDTTDQRLTKIEKMVGKDHKTNALVALLLGIDGTARYGEMAETPARQRDQMIQILIQLLADQAARHPVLIVFEDLHWIDPTSLELLEILLEYIKDHQIMILATSRPALVPLFDAHSSVIQVQLNRLSKDMSYAIVAKLTKGKTLPDEIMEIIARRTDGVPLFIEELTKTILESGALIEEPDSFRVDGSLQDIAIPATLHDSLTARLDRLGPIKEIAQIAACIGREFSKRIVAQICDLPENELQAAFDQLIEAEMIHIRGIEPWASYVFKHALVRDAAYESLLKERRRLFHKRILAALETEPDTAPELLATHAEVAGLTKRAIALWGTAGMAAISRPAYKEGEAHLRRAIALNAPAAASKDKEALSKALALHVHLSVALTPAKGLWSDEVIATLEEALTLADEVGVTPLRGDIIYGLLLGTCFRGNLKSSIARADELMALASASGDVAQYVAANRLAAIARLSRGRFTEAQPYLDDALQLCDEIADQDLTTRFGHDPIVALNIYQSMNATHRGHTARAESYKTDADKRARKIGHTNTTCTMLGLAVICTHISGDLKSEKRISRILKPMVEEHNVAASRLGANATFALLKMAEGDVEGLDAYRKAEANILNANIRLFVPGHRVTAARRALDLGLIDDARALTAEAETMMNSTGEKSWLPDVYRLRALFAVQDKDPEAAEKYLWSAINTARRGGGTLWEMRAALDLAALLQKSDRWEEAIEMIAPILASIKRDDCPKEVSAAKKLMAAMTAA